MSTWWIDPTAGGGGDGSEANPFDEWADLSLSSGDTVNILPGTLNESINITSLDSITVNAYGGTVTVTGPSGTDAIFLQTANNCTFNGPFHCTGSAFSGVRLRLTCNGNTFNDITASLNGVHGFQHEATAAGTNTFNRCVADANVFDGFNVHETAVMNCNYCVAKNHVGTSPAGDGYTTHDTSVMNVYKCSSINNNDGFHLTHTSGTTTVDSCYVEMDSATGDDGVHMAGGGSVLIKNCKFLIKGSGLVRTLRLESNVAHSVLNNTFVSHNTGSTSAFIWVNDASTAVTARNNVFYRKTESHGFWVSSGTATKSAQVATNNVYYSVSDLTASIFMGGNWAAWIAAVGSAESGTLVHTDPLLINATTGTAPCDFDPLRESPCIDAGADLTGSGVTVDWYGRGRPRGGSFDIGAVEHALRTDKYESTPTRNYTRPMCNGYGDVDVDHFGSGALELVFSKPFVAVPTFAVVQPTAGVTGTFEYMSLTNTGVILRISGATGITEQAARVWFMAQAKGIEA